VPRNSIIQGQIREQVRSRKINDAAIEISTELEGRSEIVRVYGNEELGRQHPNVAALINGRAITLEQLATECFDRHANPVLEGEIHRTILRQELAKRKIVVGQTDLDDEVRRAAESFGFIERGEVNVQAWLEQVEIQYPSLEVYIRDAVWPTVALKRLTTGKVKVTEADMKKGFEANYGPRVEVLAIVLRNERKALDVWEMANGNRTEQFFGELASTYSIEPTSQGNFGRVPPIRKHGGSKAIEEEAFRLNAGELSGLIGTGDNYIILYCLGRTEPVVTEMVDVREELHQELFERGLRIKMGKEMERLLEAAKTQSFVPGRRVVEKTTSKTLKR
jgi:parvulin-like peptidyl-prolyl isomerase